jgi:hypothetical protein
MAAFWLGAEPFVGNEIEVGAGTFSTASRFRWWMEPAPLAAALMLPGLAFGGFDQIFEGFVRRVRRDRDHIRENRPR